MSMSDCIKCWNTPCTCGYSYKNWSQEERIKLALVVIGAEHGEGVDLQRIFIHLKEYIKDDEENYERQIKEEEFSGNVAKENFWRGARMAIGKLDIWLSQQTKK